VTADPADRIDRADRADPVELAGREAAPAPPPSMGLPVDPELPDPAVPATDPRVLAVIALGGAVGGPLRYALEELHPAGAGAFPLTTFLVNVSGAFALGLFVALLLSRSSRSRFLRPLVATGFLGAYTTFSTVAVELVTLGKDGHVAMAIWYAVVSLSVGLAAAWTGLGLGRRLALEPTR
jgi:fluoride exporter